MHLWPCSVMGKGGFYYFDTVHSLKTIWEVVKASDKIFGETYLYPSGFPNANSDKMIISKITQVGFVIRNLEEVMKNYCDILGIGPWDIYESRSLKHVFTANNGRKADLDIRTATAVIGDVQLELIQPLSTDSIFGDFLARQGEGIHHIQFASDGIDETVHMMKEKGIATLLSGRYGDGSFAFFDTGKALKVTFEAFQAPSVTFPPTTRYP